MSYMRRPAWPRAQDQRGDGRRRHVRRLRVRLRGVLALLQGPVEAVLRGRRAQEGGCVFGSVSTQPAALRNKGAQREGRAGGGAVHQRPETSALSVAQAAGCACAATMHIPCSWWPSAACCCCRHRWLATRKATRTLTNRAEPANGRSGHYLSTRTCGRRAPCN
jgi:hypothetical protein